MAKYAIIKMNRNKTKKEAEIMRIKNEIRLLHKKKSITNKNLYCLHNDAVKAYGEI